MSDAIVVMTTFDNPNAAQALANQLIGQRLAACVQVIGPMTSTYRWQGKIENSREWLALIKTRAQLWPALERFIRAHHGYDTPEIMAIPAESVSDTYLAWLIAETT